jgi:CHAT domain-containing protein
MTKCRLFLLLSFCINVSHAQSTFQQQVWARFYTIVKSKPEEQPKAFKALQDSCIARGLTTDSTFTNLLFLYAGAEFASSQPKSALNLVSKAIRIASNHPTLNPPQYLAKYHFYAGYYYSQAYAYDLAMLNYFKSLEIAQKAIDKWSIRALACQAISHSYYQIQDYQSGLQYAEMGCIYAIESRNQSALARNMYEKCVNLNALGRIDEAARDARTLISIIDENIPDFELGSYAKLFGDIESNRQLYHKAHEWYSKSSYYYKKSGHQEELGGIYLDLHATAIAMKDVKAINKYQNLARRYINNPYYLSRFHNNIALYQASKGHYKESMTLFSQALIDLPIKFNPKNTLSNPSAAMLRDLTEKDYALTVLMDKAAVLLKEPQNLPAALETYELIDSLTDFIRWEQQGSIIQYFWRDKMSRMYEDAIETCFMLNKTDKAFYFIEKSHSSLLNDALNNVTARNMVPVEKARYEEQLRLKLSSVQAAYPQDPKAVTTAQHRLKAFVNSLEHEYPVYFEYKYNNRVPTINEVQDYLKNSGQSILSYYEGTQGLYLLAITPASVAFKKIELSAYKTYSRELSVLIKNKGLLNQQFNQYLFKSHKLYLLLFQPIEKMLKGRVIISTEANMLPFSALSSSGVEERFLLRKYAFSYTYSVRGLLRKRNNKDKTKIKGDFLGLAPVDFSNSLALTSLPYSAEAVKNNAQYFKKSKIITGASASKKIFIDEWQRYSTVQVITHAYADDQQQEPKLYFADSSLTLSEIGNNSYSATQILMLSACRTSMGKEQRGEGIKSLARTFIAAGTPTVISTLWEIEDKDAYSLSDLIWKETSKNLPLDLALQKAQLTWITSGDRSNVLPYSWAGIIITGDTQNERKKNRDFIMIVFVTLVALLIAFTIYFNRK